MNFTTCYTYFELVLLVLQLLIILLRWIHMLLDPVVFLRLLLATSRQELCTNRIVAFRAYLQEHIDCLRKNFLLEESQKSELVYNRILYFRVSFPLHTPCMPKVPKIIMKQSIFSPSFCQFMVLSSRYTLCATNKCSHRSLYNIQNCDCLHASFVLAFGFEV